MNRIPVILDTDTGVDDAIAIMLINKLPQFDVRCLTSVAGNVEVEKTTINALRVLELIGLDVPVYPGADIPMYRDQVTASYIHGQNGLGDLDIPLPKKKPMDIPAWDAIYNEAVACGGELVLIAVGPLTNLGMAFMKYRELPKLIKKIVIMGGAASGGNVTPAAEFNIFADPDAADLVFTCGVPVYMCGLDVTMKAYLTEGEIDEIAAMGSAPARFFGDVVQGVLKFSHGLGLPGMCMHDPVAVLYAAGEGKFETEHVGVRVETKGVLTKGKTVTDLYSDKQIDHNAYIVTDIDREDFKKRVFKLMAEYK